MIKRIIICLFCICFLSSCAFAAPVAVINSETLQLSLSGESEEAVLSVMITNKAADSVTKENFSGSVFMVYEIKTDDSGKYNCEFMLPDNILSGEYIVYVGNESTSFYYADKSEIDECIEAVKGADDDNIESILSKYTYDKKILFLPLEGDYKLYADTANEVLLKLIKEKAPEGISDIKLYFEKAVEASLILRGSSDEIEKSFEKNSLALEFDNADTKKVAEMFFTVRGDCEFEDLEKTLRTSVAIVKINESTKGKMTDVIEEYNDVLELDIDGKYSKLDKVEVNKYLLGKDFKSVEEVREAFENGVKKVSGKKTQSGGSTSSGGGMSSGGGSTIISAGVKPVDTVPVSQPIKTDKYFDDLSEVDWAQEHINALAEKGIIKGVGERMFAPKRSVTREEYIKMLIEALGINKGDGETVFSDVDINSWYAPYVNAALGAGIVNGVSVTKFGTGEKITREQMAAMTVRAMEYKGIKMSEGDIRFTDIESISDYAHIPVKKLCKSGVISGMPNGSFAPKEYLTRAQAAKIINLMIKEGAGK